MFAVSTTVLLKLMCIVLLQNVSGYVSCIKRQHYTMWHMQVQGVYLIYVNVDDIVQLFFASDFM